MASAVIGVPEEHAGFSVLEALATLGWSIAITAGVDQTVMVRATRGPQVLTREGESVGEAARLVFDAALRKCERGA